MEKKDSQPGRQIRTFILAQGKQGQAQDDQGDDDGDDDDDEELPCQ